MKSRTCLTQERLSWAPDPSFSEKSKKSKKKGGRKNKSSSRRKFDYPDPATSTSADMCAALDIQDVTIEYTEEDYSTITNLKSFINRVRPTILESNPKCNATKVYPLIQVKYREFQEDLAAQGRSQAVKKAEKRPKPPVEQDKLVAPIKIRISARKKRRNDSDEDGGAADSDQEFESLLKQHEHQLDEEEKEKEERKASRAAQRADRKKQAIERLQANRRAKKAKGEEEEVSDVPPSYI
ncbi:unnamed protein product [Strongylus vulgaris]|uniref:CHD N-terminal domain-containing protein n=1 Tax=Strongylus vulgaris TaxID=40348 RepID=A0A3P7L1L7_STRVU|nr:unnamed protein product [Strongylus vulgaris]